MIVCFAQGKGGTSAKCAEPNSAVLDGMNSGGGAKNVKVLRPTAVKPPPLQMDLSKQGQYQLIKSRFPTLAINAAVCECWDLRINAYYLVLFLWVLASNKGFQDDCLKCSRI